VRLNADRRCAFLPRRHTYIRVVDQVQHVQRDGARASPHNGSPLDVGPTASILRRLRPAGHSSIARKNKNKKSLTSSYVFLFYSFYSSCPPLSLAKFEHVVDQPAPSEPHALAPDVSALVGPSSESWSRTLRGISRLTRDDRERCRLELVRDVGDELALERVSRSARGGSRSP